MPELPSTNEGLSYPINPTVRAEYLRDQYEQQNVPDEQYYIDTLWAHIQMMDPRMRRAGIVMTYALRSALDKGTIEHTPPKHNNSEEHRLDKSLHMLRKGYNPILLEQNNDYGNSRRYFTEQINAYDLDPSVRNAILLSLDILHIRTALNETLDYLSSTSSSDIINNGERSQTTNQEKADAFIQDLLFRGEERETLGYVQLCEALPALHAKRRHALESSFGDRADEASKLIMAFLCLRTSLRSYKETVQEVREPFLEALEKNDLDEMKERIYDILLTNPNLLTDAQFDALELGERSEWLDLIEADKLSSNPDGVNHAAELYDANVTDLESARKFYEDFFAGKTFVHDRRDGTQELIHVKEFVDVAYPQGPSSSDLHNYGFKTEILNRTPGSKRPNSRYSIRNALIRVMTGEWTEQPSA